MATRRVHVDDGGARQQPASEAGLADVLMSCTLADRVPIRDIQRRSA